MDLHFLFQALVSPGLVCFRRGAVRRLHGLLSTGLLLAKVVDPDHKTVAAETVAASCTLGYSYSLPYLLIMPMLIIRNPKLVFGISVVLLFVFLIAGEIFRKKEAVSN